VGGTDTDVKSRMPDSDDQLLVPDGENAGEVNRVGAPEGMAAGQVAGMPLDLRGELDRTRRGPVLLPGLLGDPKVALIEVVVAARGCERGTHLGIGQSA
jgi:hypothetical protein